MPRRISFAEVRQRLYDKFIGQEGIPLPPTFNVVFVPHTINPSAPAGNWTTDVVQVINLESEWEQLMSTVQRDNKITLRIQDISTTNY